MKQHITALLTVILVTTITFAGTGQCSGAKTVSSVQADEILNASGVKGGLVVVIGCDDPTTAAGLRANEKYTVQCLDTDDDKIDEARKSIKSMGDYGMVSVAKFDGKTLPYVGNLVNLIVSEKSKVERDEIMRVLAPGGVAIINGDRITKPVPPEIDEWQQHFHGADNNAVAQDSVVGPPRHFQWINDPQWARSHMTLPSITSLISSGGRLFTIEDRASIEHPALPGKYALVARDAFNGIMLWKMPFPDWHPVNTYVKHTPAQLQRRLVAVGDTAYCTPGYSAPVTALDAATGKVLKVYKGTERTQEFALDRGVLFLVIGDETDTEGLGEIVDGSKGSSGSKIREYRDGLRDSQFPIERYGPRIPRLENPKSKILAIQAKSGKKLWEKSGDDTEGYQGTSLTIRGKHTVYHTADALVCLDSETGKQLWRVPIPYDKLIKAGMSASLILSDDAVYMADAKKTMAFSIKDGSSMWTGRVRLNHCKAADLFLANDLVWSSYYNGHDPTTGEIVKTLTQQMIDPMGHDRCYRNRITDRYYINTKTGGSDYLDLETSGEFPHPWARSTCGIGHLPCNGLLYLGPAACSCVSWVTLNAMNALAPEPGLKSSAQPVPVKTKLRLEKGSAYSEILDLTSEISAADWPTYRHDETRGGVASTAVSAKLKTLWTAKVRTRASAPTIAAGKVFISDIDAHTILALDASSGKAVWEYTVGSRVDSPPSFYKGMLLFGSKDGWVYCLRASDGALAWRFKDLPDRQICAYSQIESAWPVCGNILVKDDVAYFAAGRNSFMDGGIFMYGLDPKTGKVIHQRHMYGPLGEEDGFPVATEQCPTPMIDGFKTDIFFTDGNLLYLSHQAFRFDLSPLKPEEVTEPHMIPSPGFLEDVPHHRSFWSIDTTLRYDTVAFHGAARGDIMVKDGKKFYEVRGYGPARAISFDPRLAGYTLFAGTYSKTADAAETETIDRNGKKTKRAKPSPMTATELWSTSIPLTGKSIVLAGDVLFVAGTPVEFPEDDLAKAYEGRMGGILWAVSSKDGEKLAEYKLDSPPAWDSMAAADGRLFMSLKDGTVVCYEGE